MSHSEAWNARNGGTKVNWFTLVPNHSFVLRIRENRKRTSTNINVFFQKCKKFKLHMCSKFTKKKMLIHCDFLKDNKQSYFLVSIPKCYTSELPIFVSKNWGTKFSFVVELGVTRICCSHYSCCMILLN